MTKGRFGWLMGKSKENRLFIKVTSVLDWISNVVGKLPSTLFRAGPAVQPVVLDL